MATKPNITHEELLKALHYDPKTGIWRWKVSRRCVRAGDVAGTKKKNGYLQIKVSQKVYLGQRLAFFYMTGEWPQNDVDHKNCTRPDNR
jgi:hypothetical protein